VQRAPAATGPWDPFAAVFNLAYTDVNRPIESLICYRIGVHNLWGASATEPRCTALPAPPTVLTASSATAGAIDLQWSDNSAFEDGYEVQRAGSNFVFVAVGSVGPDAKAYRDATVAADTWYHYRVRAKKGAGYSGFSNVVEAVSASAIPAAPLDTRALPSSSTAISVAWQDASSTEEGFRVERAPTTSGPWDVVDRTPRAQASLTDVDRIPDAQSCYRVIAFNSRGDSPPSPVDCTTPPRGPTNLTATALSSSTIRVTWSDESSVEDGYEVQQVVCYPAGYYYYYYYPYCYAYAVVTLASNVTSWDMTGLVPYQTFTFQVVAIKRKGLFVGYSDVSNQATATTPP
jgi:hypothetical protein